ncbi:MAG TPA: leucyl/phenylalanyl-tRNA--protein transferase [Acidimicrobiales bacterium]|nr:leucyl/phenylalanyl-tRNA--protein transferase [Acidimicrobiales bacterium]
MTPVQPPPTAWAFPRVDEADADGLVGVGADLEPGTILAAYRRGLFPMPIGRRGTLGWWSPDPRAIVPLDGLVVSRSLRRSARRFEIRVDTAFDEVIDACADPARPHGWITPEVLRAYTRLHGLGWVHSVEAWSLDDGELAGGLYGVAIGGLFAGESMFHRRTDASKVALLALVDLLRRGDDPAHRLLDVQWLTPHLENLGAVEVSRTEYLDRVDRAVELPLPEAFTGGPRL